MEIEYTCKALDDIAFYKKSGDIKSQVKITQLIEDIQAHYATGIGKPELLKGNYSGLYSRRINKKDRIIYKPIGHTIYIYSLRGHYDL